MTHKSMLSGRSLDSVKRKTRNKKVVLICISAVAVATVVVLSIVKIPGAIENANTYAEALQYAEDQKYGKAYDLFMSLDGYKDSEIKATELVHAQIPENLNAGDEIFFRIAFQDRPATWMVLAVEDDRALLISKDCIDVNYYNDEPVDVTWETCTLRGWLNDIFYNAAFNEKQKARILTTTVQNMDNATYGTSGGNDTEDKVFLLSIDEANTYFEDGEARISNYYIWPPGYDEEEAKRANYREPYFVAKPYVWLLRSPGSNAHRFSFVFADGRISDDGNDVEEGFAGVRPALWINLNP